MASSPAIARAQRMKALQSANDKRTKRAKLRQDLKACDLPDAIARFGQLTASPPEYLRNYRVLDLVSCLPGFADSMSERALLAAGVTSAAIRTVEALTPRQQTALVEVVAHPSLLKARRAAAPRKATVRSRPTPPSAQDNIPL